MDEMKIQSKLLRGVIGKVIRKIIRAKFGFDISLTLNDFYISYDDENASIHLDANAKVDKNNLESLLKDADLL